MNKIAPMTLTFTYYHDTGKIGLRIHLSSDEEAFAIGLGANCKEAEDYLKGWIYKNAGLYKKNFILDMDKPFIALMKKKMDGSMTKTSNCINILNQYPPGKEDQITVRNYTF
jgi:hypothetical protein